MLLDIRYALRRFRREVGFTLAAVLVIAMAVGAGTTVFSLVDSLLLGDLPGVGQPQRRVEVGRTQRGEGMDTESYPEKPGFELADALWKAASRCDDRSGQI